MKALEWLARGQESENPFDAFSNYWRGFNNLYAGKGHERDLISNYLAASIDEIFCQELINTFPAEIAILIESPVIDMRGNRRDTEEHINRFHQSKTAIEKIVSLFMIVYQIRCNFEHGQKSPSRRRDRDLCESACPLVAAIVRKNA